jgi:hypothetical protein
MARASGVASSRQVAGPPNSGLQQTPPSRSLGPRSRNLVRWADE